MHDPISTPSVDRATLEKRHHSGSGWFGTIAVLSAVNIAVVFANLSFSFPVGLGIASVAAAFLMQKDGANLGLIKGIGLLLMILSILVIGMIWLCRVQARKRQAWAYALGMGLFAFDALITLLFRDWISFGFHAWGLYSIWIGYAACKALNQAPLPEAEPMESPLPEALPSEP